jgi:hypothetical protein
LAITSRKLRCALTIFYAVISLIAAWAESPHAY